MKYTYTIDGKHFPSKAAVFNYVRSEILTTPNHTDLRPEHLRFMVDLLGYHQHSDQKLGSGVKRMWIQSHPPYNNRGFTLQRIDGIETDFSYLQCLNHPSPLSDFKGACRNAVAPTVIAFKQDHFKKYAVNGKVVCAVTGKKLTVRDCHVDHEPPATFEAIVSEFIKANNIDVEKAPLADHTDGKIGNWFADEEYEAKWIQFHNERAKLRVISILANLSLTKLAKL